MQAIALLTIVVGCVVLWLRQKPRVDRNADIAEYLARTLSGRDA
jgi:hypothetical protein